MWLNVTLTISSLTQPHLSNMFLLTYVCCILSFYFVNGWAAEKPLMRSKIVVYVWAVMEITSPFGTGTQESQRQQIKSKMKYANVIIFIRECLWQKAINFSPASWHFNICITCFLQMIIFVFSISVDRALFSFPVRLVIFLNFLCLKSVMASDWNFIQKKKN